MIMGNLHLVTGYAGEEHITSNDQGSFNAALMGTGEFVLERGRQFEAQVISNNTVRIFDGDLLMQGRHIRLKEDTYVDLLFENGMQGYKRTDLIAVRYEKDSITSIESASLVVIKGIQTEDTYVSPEKITGDIISEHALQNDTILYKMNFDGLSIQEPEKVFTTVPTLETMKEEAIGQIAEEAEKAIQNLRGIVQTEFATLVNTLVGEKLAKAVVIAETAYRFSAVKTWGVKSYKSELKNWGFYKLGENKWDKFLNMGSTNFSALYPFANTGTQYLIKFIEMVPLDQEHEINNQGLRGKFGNGLVPLDFFMSWVKNCYGYWYNFSRSPDSFSVEFYYSSNALKTSPWETAFGDMMKNNNYYLPFKQGLMDGSRIFFRMTIINLFELFSESFLNDPNNFFAKKSNGVFNAVYYSNINLHHIPLNDNLVYTDEQ